MRMRIENAVIILAFCLLGAGAILNMDIESTKVSKYTEVAQSEQTDPVIEIISQHLGLPYKEFGFKDSDGKWVEIKDKHDYEKNDPGYNCTGFVTQVARDLYGDRITFESVSKKRSVTGELVDQSDDRALFGRDVIRNIADIANGRSIPSPSPDIDTGFRPAQYEMLRLNLRTDQVYFLDVYSLKNGKRLDVHVAILLATQEGMMVFESTKIVAPNQAVGSTMIPLDDFLKKYGAEKYGILAVECPLPQL